MSSGLGVATLSTPMTNRPKSLQQPSQRLGSRDADYRVWRSDLIADLRRAQSVEELFGPHGRYLLRRTVDRTLQITDRAQSLWASPGDLEPELPFRNLYGLVILLKSNQIMSSRGHQGIMWEACKDINAALDVASTPREFKSLLGKCGITYKPLRDGDVLYRKTVSVDPRTDFSDVFSGDARICEIVRASFAKATAKYPRVSCASITFRGLEVGKSFTPAGILERLQRNAAESQVATLGPQLQGGLFDVAAIRASRPVAADDSPAKKALN